MTGGADEPEVTGGQPPAADPRDRLFTADASDLDKRSAKGSAVLMVSQAVEFGTGVLSMMYLGRVLYPADFGLVAMGYSVLIPVLEVREAGLPAALIQRKNLNAAQGDAMFWLNARLQIGLSLLVALSAYPMSLIYGEPMVVPIILIFAGMLLLTGFSIMHRGLMRRRMRFSTMAKIEGGSEVIGGVVACTAAFLGAGWWALVIQQLTAQFLKAGGYWACAGWVPTTRAVRGCETVNEMRVYGRRVTFSRMIEQFLGKLDQVLVGAQAGDTGLGLYNRAFKWSVQPTRQLFSPLQQVVVSGSSKLQDEAERFRACFVRGLGLTFTVVVPIMVWMMLGAGDFIRLLLGPKWNDAVPIFRVLALGGLAGSTVYMTRWLYLAEGTTARQLRWSMIQAPLVVAALLVGMQWGAIGVAWGFTGAMVLLAGPRVLYATRGSRVTAVDYGLSALRPLTAGAMAVVPAGWLQFWVMAEVAFYWRLPAVWACFVVFYLGFFMLLPGGMAQARVLWKGLRAVRG
ncbi:MAG: lipopolysaccharide biosynthesis protein [Planctomycetota bacterium]